MPELVAISVASLVQSVNSPASMLTSESNPVAPVTKSPSASSMGKMTDWAVFFFSGLYDVVVF